jgi:hypothetical protein
MNRSKRVQKKAVPKTGKTITKEKVDEGGELGVERIIDRESFSDMSLLLNQRMVNKM